MTFGGGPGPHEPDRNSLATLIHETMASMVDNGMEEVAILLSNRVKCNVRAIWHVNSDIRSAIESTVIEYVFEG